MDRGVSDEEVRLITDEVEQEAAEQKKLEQQRAYETGEQVPPIDPEQEALMKQWD